MKYYLLHVLTIDREALPPIILIATCVNIPARHSTETICRYQPTAFDLDLAIIPRLIILQQMLLNIVR